ncbi:MAG: peptide chain release factor N(5)-glutamine methyltransferase [Chitinophagaceae bacterium]|nr:peptide chain release factor N(5)-glutamine methyltransferase [Chitinophagaceae bacterium]
MRQVIPFRGKYRRFDAPLVISEESVVSLRMTIHQAQQQLKVQLYDIHEPSEAEAIAAMVIESMTGWKRIDQIINKTLPLTKPQIAWLEQITSELLMHRPVQYVLRECWFANLRLFVDESVLIPRPETEELVDWIIRDLKRVGSGVQSTRILDIGTGSGCIALALQSAMPSSAIFACDISQKAIEVAARNANTYQLPVNFILADILASGAASALPHIDVIVSNPPYIPQKGRASMNRNVVEFEPSIALFVPDDDALIFYRAIADFAKTNLTEEGSIYFEIHEGSANEIVQLLGELGWQNVELRNDMQGKERMIRVQKVEK